MAYPTTSGSDVWTWTYAGISLCIRMYCIRFHCVLHRAVPVRCICFIGRTIYTSSILASSHPQNCITFVPPTVLRTCLSGDILVLECSCAPPKDIAAGPAWGTCRRNRGSAPLRAWSGNRHWYSGRRWRNLECSFRPLCCCVPMSCPYKRGL